MGRPLFHSDVHAPDILILLKKANLNPKHLRGLRWAETIHAHVEVVKSLKNVVVDKFSKTSKNKNCQTDPLPAYVLS